MAVAYTGPTLIRDRFHFHVSVSAPLPKFPLISCPATLLFGAQRLNQFVEFDLWGHLNEMSDSDPDNITKSKWSSNNWHYNYTWEAPAHGYTRYHSSPRGRNYRIALGPVGPSVPYENISASGWRPRRGTKGGRWIIEIHTESCSLHCADSGKHSLYALIIL